MVFHGGADMHLLAHWKRKQDEDKKRKAEEEARRGKLAALRRREAAQAKRIAHEKTLLRHVFKYFDLHSRVLEGRQRQEFLESVAEIRREFPKEKKLVSALERASGVARKNCEKESSVGKKKT